MDIAILIYASHTKKTLLYQSGTLDSLMNLCFPDFLIIENESNPIFSEVTYFLVELNQVGN